MTIPTHYGTTSDQVAKAIIQALSALVISGATGCVRSLGRIEQDEDPEDIERGLAAGLPGLLLCFKGGKFTPNDTSLQRFDEEMRFRILCCVGVTRDGDERFAGSQQDPDVLTPAVLPGVEDLQDWALYFACRAARMSGIRKVTPTSRSQAQTVKPGLLAAALDLVVTRQVDVYDDATGNTLLSIGICHSPLDYDDLFEVDNTTPKSEFPRTTDGGVATL